MNLPERTPEPDHATLGGLSADWTEDSRSAEELFAATLEGDCDDEAPWNAVRSLRLRGTPEVFELAKKYHRAENAVARARALDVLAQLGAGKPSTERPYLAESVSMAIYSMGDANDAVVRSAAWALSHLGGEQAVATLIANKRHPDADVRQAVAVGLAGSDRPEVSQTLTELMEDRADEVRNWATFGLGSQFIEAGSGPIRLMDSAEIRAALRGRIDDPFEDVRDEALWGLAQRKDPPALRSLLERLESEASKAGDRDAAEIALGLDGTATTEQLRAGLKKLLEDNG